jgi:molybdopterin molybdotransferase
MSPSVLTKEKILSFEDARQTVEQHATKFAVPSTERIPLDASEDRILAETIHADRDLPPFPRAMRDGYAVKAADLANLPAKLKILGEIKAGGDPSNLQISAGEAVAIMTGAPAPSGADAVVMVEHTSREGDIVQITKGIDSGENIVPTGAEARLGATILSPGLRINVAAIAVAASVGKSDLLVNRKPRVAILSTGDEIVAITQTPGPHQIRNSNMHSLAAQVRIAGAEPVLLPIAPDEKVRLRELIEQGLQSDLLLLSGGVSVGRYDFVEQVLEDLGAEFFFTGALIQPGKPVVFGRARGKYFFGLPGNPISTMVTFELFARPLIEALSGAEPRNIRFLRAKLKSSITRKSGLKRFLPGMLSGEFENTEVELAPWQGSGDLASTARTNCYVVVAADRETIEAGDWIPVLPR